MCVRTTYFCFRYISMLRNGVFGSITETFQEFLNDLPRLTYETMKIAAIHADNITASEPFTEEIDTKSLRSYAFEACS